VNERAILLEEILIREAVSRIRNRLREEGRGGKSLSSPRLAIRFCGGCNPVIERGAVAQGIREELKAEVTWVSEENEKDLLLIVNGCRTACADTAEIRSGHPAIVVAGDSVSE